MADLPDALPDDVDACIDLYFACEDPEERDGFVESFVRRQGADAQAFLRAMMVMDADPYVRLRAAAALAKHGDEAALGAIEQALAISADDDILRVAIDAWLDVRGADAAPALLAILQDGERGHLERRLAQEGLTAADCQQAAAAFVTLLESSVALSLDDLQGMMPALLSTPAVREGASAALRRRLQETLAQGPALTEQAAHVTDEFARECALDRLDEAEERIDLLRACLVELESDGAA